MSSGSAFAGLVVAVIGGDAREQEIARLAAETGAQVRAYGFPWPDLGIAGVAHCRSATEAMNLAHYALFPVAGMGTDGSLYAPHAEQPLFPTARLLAALAPRAAVVLGRADEGLRLAARSTEVDLMEYEDDDEMMLLRGPAIVEGVLAEAITNSPVTLHASAVGVVGFGNVGSLLARALSLLGASVHVFARNPVQRAGAYTIGCIPHPLEDMALVGPNLAMLFSTVPARVVHREVLQVLPAGSLVIDVAAPPGGVDLGAARDLGHRAIWARGMGRSAPVTVGRSQWYGIAHRIAQREERKATDES